jgi:predicted ATP-dependent endonuclease of OLD family
MRLKAFQVKNYKTIQDSGRVEIDSNVACLMGKNESGKSASMQALWKFNNVSGSKFDRLFDLPAEQYTRLRGTDPEVVVLEFTMEPADKLAFLADFKALKTAPDVVTVHSTYDGKRTFDVQLNYTPARYSTISATIQSIIPALGTVEQNTTDAAEKEKLLAAVTALTTMQTSAAPDKTAEEVGTAIIKAALASLQAIPPERLGATLHKTAVTALSGFAVHSQAADMKGKVDKWLDAHLPVFIYFEDYGRLKTRMNLTDFIAKQLQHIQNALKDSEEQMLVRTQIALFEWAKLDPAELQKLGLPKQATETQEVVNRRKDERARILESASYHLSGDWMDWWDQRTHTLHISADGDDLELRVSDNVNPWKIPFGERSRGFQWFFSFYLTFLVESGKAYRGAIVLLDEPGLHLHPKAQLKLLAFFQRIAKKNQVVYSSHSMFMVDPNHVDNVRTVYLKAEDPENPKSRAYTHVSSGPEPEGDSETLLPMQAAGAYQLAQTLFLGKRTLIVEGISDYWLIKAVSNYLQEKTKDGLHDDTVVLWAGGTSHMLPLASVISSGEQLGPNRMAVLLDSDRAGADKAKKLIDMLVHGQDSVMLMGDIINIPRAQAEDVPTFDELLRGLKEMGRTPVNAPTRKAGETNVELLQRLFQENGWGDLTHEMKAKVMLHMVDLWRSGTLIPEAETLVRARAVVSAVNSAFDKLFAGGAVLAVSGGRP